MKFEIFYDAYQEAMWFKSLSSFFKDAILVPINGSTDPEVIKLLRYDKPDIILKANGKARISLEKTTEVPTGHNIGQRFGRIVCAAEEKVLGIYFGPFAAKKHGKYASKCWINIRQLAAMLNLHKFHKVPSLAVNWPCDSEFELIRNGSETKELAMLIREYIKSGFKNNVSSIKAIESEMGSAIKEGLVRYRKYDSPPASAKLKETKEYYKDLRLVGYKFPDYFKKRNNSIHYVVGMKAGLRADPFTGTQLVYDYAYCRIGPRKNQRKTNLVMEIPDLKIADWEMVTNNQRKDKRLLSMFPDLLILKDGYV